MRSLYGRGRTATRLSLLSKGMGHLRPCARLATCKYHSSVFSAWNPSTIHQQVARHFFLHSSEKYPLSCRKYVHVPEGRCLWSARVCTQPPMSDMGSWDQRGSCSGQGSPVKQILLLWCRWSHRATVHFIIHNITLLGICPLNKSIHQPNASPMTANQQTSIYRD